MADVIEPATSGRAKCRGCARSIQRGELRFGESAPNAYAEGETLLWFHVQCAACMRPEKFLETLNASTLEIPEREWLKETALQGAAHRRLPRLARAERAASSRAHCRLCKEAIEKGELRLVLQVFEDGRMNPIGTIHVKCAEAYFGTVDIVERVARLSPDLAESMLNELSRALSS